VNTEEVLIFLLALASGLSLFVGLAQALDGRPPRLPTRRAHAASPHHRRHPVAGRTVEPRGRVTRVFSAPPGSVVATVETSPLVEPEQISLLDPPVEEVVPPPAVSSEAATDRPEDEALTVVTVEPPPPIEAARTESEPAPTVAAVPAPDPVAECMRLLRSGDHEELLATVEPVLKARGRGRARPEASYERALLWGMAGLASKARGDDAATRAALEQGIRSLPKSDLGPPEARLVPVAESVGSQLLAGGEAAGDGSASTLAGLRLSVGLLRAVAIAEPGQAETRPGSGEAAVEGDPELAAGAGADDLPSWGKALRAHLAVERAREALATAAGQRLGGFLAKRDHVSGHRWLREAMGWEELGDRRGAVEAAYWQSVGGEVMRLTGQAQDKGNDLEAAMAALQSAEDFVQALPREAAESPRMDEIRRRLWWGHLKLGVERMQSADVTEALEPLFRALHLAGGDPDRESETRHTLAQALETLAAGASETVEGRLRSGDRDAAEAAGQELCRAIDRGLAEGVSQEEMAGALTTRQYVMTRIAQADEQ
jgi:hypothetical protein